ncbi:MAG: phenylalanine--tRNA ligase subunit beta [Candidatus Fibromonas sp.]|jgi:phenylalanyl-tRNA synthetase beta chain|nr:phenylalanine--tRNA ligase subunit beta [Candidatus Fibromonas sp.]
MKISLNWLKRFIELKASVEEISLKLTSLGFEIEGIEEFGKTYSGLLVAEVLECNPHPDSDHLSLTKVFDGKETLQVVCGAPNVKAGIKAVLAPIGVELPLPDGKSLKMKKSKIRGVESFGMLCAEDEIGLSQNHDGILILPQDAPVGKPFADLDFYDTVFGINLTPNRADALSHLGIARELAAAFGVELKMPVTAIVRALPATPLQPLPSIQQLTITAPAACPHYVGRIINDVKIAPSPEWMQKLLKAVGMNPINNVVDITNFVLMDIGQPLHSFDLGRLNGGEVRVRFAEEGEKFTTLDHKEHILRSTDLAICDGNRPACLAGVMGGLESEITEQTKDVFLEAAYFNPTVVRKQSKRLGISSDSSYRFERGVDFDLQNFASDYACALIAELADGKIAEQKLEFISQENLPKRPAVPLREERIEKLLGLKIPLEQAKKLLASIGIKETAENSGLYSIPSYRFDLEREADLIEEVARLIGYDKIPYDIPSFKAEPNDLPLQERINRKIRSSLSALGLHECLSLRFTSKRKTEWVFGASESDKRANPAVLLNPLSEELAVLPTSLLPNLIFSAAENAKHQKSVRLFEVSKAQFPTPETANERDPGFKEIPLLAMVYAEPKAEFFAFKGLLNAFFKRLRISVNFEASENPEMFLHPGRSCVLKLGKKILGSCGELHPAVQGRFDLKLNTFVCEIDLSVLETAFLAPVSFKEFSKQMIIERDVSIEAEESVTHAELLSKFKGFNPKHLASIELLSIYQGDKIAAGKKNLLYRFYYQAPDRTLTDEEINVVHTKFREKIAGTGLVLR